jgi:AcrR family transcriptional regulator
MPRTRRGWLTRQRLIDAATTVINAEGYQSATIEGIAQQAGVPIGLYYRYFTDKTDIALTALETAADAFRSATPTNAVPQALFDREMAIHEMLYEMLRDNFRLLSGYFSARKEDRKLVEFVQDQTNRFLNEHYNFISHLPGGKNIKRETFVPLGHTLIAFSENTLYRLFAGLAGDLVAPRHSRAIIVHVMTELRYRAITCRSRKAPNYTPQWTMRLRAHPQALTSEKARLIDSVFRKALGSPPEVEQPDPRRADSRATLEQIETSTLECLNLYGSDALRLADIERASGVTRGAIYYHFKNRESLVRKVLIEWLAGFEHDLEKLPDDLSAPAYDQLRTIVAVFVETFKEAPGALRVIHELESTDPAVSLAYRRCRAVFARRLAHIILTCGAGATPSAETLGIVLHAMIAMTERLVRVRFVFPDAALLKAMPKSEDVIAVLAAVIHRMAWAAEPAIQHRLPAPVG